MSLDIRFTVRTKTVCPHCGQEIAGGAEVETAESGGRAWYPFLEDIGYYVPYELRTEENNWYGKDMALTEEEVKAACIFAKRENVYNWREIVALIATATMEKHSVVVNADW